MVERALKIFTILKGECLAQKILNYHYLLQIF